MSLTDELPRLDRLLRLTGHRESAALAALREAHSAMAAAQQALDTQQQVIDELQAQLHALIDWQQGCATPSADDLVAWGNRRRWLTFDLEKERYYFGVTQSDWRDARRQVNAARRAWLALNGRLDALKLRQTGLQRQQAQHTERSVDQAQDDRTNMEFVFNG